MSAQDGKSIDFDVLKEPWNKYELKDGSTLKTKFVLKKVLVKNLSESKASFGFDGQGMFNDDPFKNKIFFGMISRKNFNLIPRDKILGVT